MTRPPRAAVLDALLLWVEAEKPASRLGAEGARQSQ